MTMFGQPLQGPEDNTCDYRHTELMARIAQTLDPCRTRHHPIRALLAKPRRRRTT
jgi:hypothetical protein